MKRSKHCSVSKGFRNSKNGWIFHKQSRSDAKSNQLTALHRTLGLYQMTIERIIPTSNKKGNNNHFRFWMCHGILKGVLSKNLQKPYICGRGWYNSQGDGTYHVDTLGPTKTRGYRMRNRCYTPLGRIYRVFAGFY